ncbi:hypothetical protein D2T29_13765 [Sinirhodobacter populi]|uniref:VPLPA-CTERM sorting domain-containing protein n=1 Tax=Paenirhodobacter populi TaxID=2306993 RepID=A0A443KAL0_9RHOB|nr:VPLPA-CTERM sorting domain-containing protein [Sinirhodobacter populi]RWR29849.1 hypothetical protein D2T29_13765 [Sinirhodobacter populi]
MNKSIFSAAFLAAALPVAAQAATVSAGSNGTAFTLDPGTSYSEIWEVGEAFNISDISFTLNGATTAAVDDIQSVVVGANGLGQAQNWSITTFGGLVSVGYTYVPGFTTSDNFIVTLSYANAPSGSVPLQATYAFTATPVVPVPAAGILLVSALAGLGVAAKRRRNKA